MSPEEAIALIARGESDRVEFKETDRADLREAVCAFANDLGGSGRGTLFVGIRDDGSFSGLVIDDALLARLAQIRSGGDLQPLPSLTVERIDFGKAGACAAIIVHPSDDPPVRYRGRIFVRVGTTTQVANAQDERLLVERRSTTNLPFDHQRAAESTSDDLDLEYFRHSYLPAAYAPDVIEMNHRSLSEQLTALRFLHRSGAATYGGLLVCGRDCQAWVPGAYLQFVVYRGKEVVDPVVDHKRLYGRIEDVARAITELLRIVTPVALSRDESSRSKDVPDYPLAALNELVINAIMHRDYESGNTPARVSIFTDRIEISNPGGPFGAVSRDALGAGGVTAYRNPVVADALKTLNYAQRFGYGIPFARAELHRNGNPAPEFQVERNFVNVVVRARPA